MVMIESFPHKINSTHIHGLSNCPSLVLLRQIVGTLIHPQPRHHFHSPCCRWTEGLCRNAWPFRDLKAMSTSLVLRLGPGEECGEVLLYLQELYQNTDFIFLYLLFLTPGGLLSFSFFLEVPAHIAAAFLGVILPSWLKLIRIKIHPPPKKKLAVTCSTLSSKFSRATSLTRTFETLVSLDYSYVASDLNIQVFTLIRPNTSVKKGRFQNTSVPPCP